MATGTTESDSKPDGSAGNRCLYNKKSHLVDKLHKMDHKDRGYAVIINNKTFEKLDERTGTDIDRDEMKKLLISMGFQEDHILVRNNCSTEQMTDVMKKAAAMCREDDDFDCFVGVILSHGTDDGNVVGEGPEDVIPVSLLTEPIRESRCEALSGKPKIFFIQMCRGEATTKGIPMTLHDAEEDECIEVYVPSESDFLLAFSSVPGYKSWRNTAQGSWFIQTVVKVFRRDEQWKRKGLLSMLTEVNRILAFDYGDKHLKQMPCINSMLTRKVIFKPKQVSM